MFTLAVFPTLLCLFETLHNAVYTDTHHELKKKERFIRSLAYTTIDPQNLLRTNQASGMKKWKTLTSFLVLRQHTLTGSWLKDYNPDCVIFSWALPSLEFCFKQSCTEVISLRYFLLVQCHGREKKCLTFLSL